MSTLVAIVATLVVAATPSPSPSPAPSLPAADSKPCGFSSSDWCPAAEGDPCGRHADEAACRADPSCRGMRFRGPTFVSCLPDGKGFWSNCPTVGCISRDPPTPADAGCRFAYGVVADLQRCPFVELPDMTIAYVGTSQADPKVPMTCRNYEVRAAGAAAAAFKQCSTGVLGGWSTFRAADHEVTVLYDVAPGCGRAPSGAWAPLPRGHAFYAGTLDADARAALQGLFDAADRACFARNPAR